MYLMICFFLFIQFSVCQSECCDKSARVILGRVLSIGLLWESNPQPVIRWETCLPLGHQRPILSVSKQYNSKSSGQILMEFSSNVNNGTGNKILCDPDNCLNPGL